MGQIGADNVVMLTKDGNAVVGVDIHEILLRAVVLLQIAVECTQRTVEVADALTADLHAQIRAAQIGARLAARRA